MFAHHALKVPLDQWVEIEFVWRNGADRVWVNGILVAHL